VISRKQHLYLTTHNTHSGQTSTPSAGFEPTVPENERPKIRKLDRVALGFGRRLLSFVNASFRMGWHFSVNQKVSEVKLVHLGSYTYLFG
jgi:hypothetical protein